MRYEKEDDNKQTDVEYVAGDDGKAGTLERSHWG